MKPLFAAMTVVAICAGLGLCGQLAYHVAKNADQGQPADTRPWEVQETDTPLLRQMTATVALKQVLRDPDSLVIEGTGEPKWRTVGHERLFCFYVQYRAKNGFGGYNRSSAWLIADHDRNAWRISK